MAVCNVIHAALDRVPERRFDDVEAFVRALAVAFEDEGAPAPKSSGLLGMFFGSKK
jgi:hypothetical protein